mmetsp:Transcript_15168/g.53244  ORF Transcript_15168/g.53244 Transcript_15168/m.53244 type:complete len:405 (+) Transcript_15168:3878-5092(+)
MLSLAFFCTLSIDPLVLFGSITDGLALPAPCPATEPRRELGCPPSVQFPISECRRALAGSAPPEKEGPALSRRPWPPTPTALPLPIGARMFGDKLILIASPAFVELLDEVALLRPIHGPCWEVGEEKGLAPLERLAKRGVCEPGEILSPKDLPGAPKTAIRGTKCSALTFSISSAGSSEFFRFLFRLVCLSGAVEARSRLDGAAGPVSHICGMVADKEPNSASALDFLRDATEAEEALTAAPSADFRRPPIEFRNTETADATTAAVLTKFIRREEGSVAAWSIALLLTGPRLLMKHRRRAPSNCCAMRAPSAGCKATAVAYAFAERSCTSQKSVASTVWAQGMQVWKHSGFPMIAQSRCNSSSPKWFTLFKHPLRRRTISVSSWPSRAITSPHLRMRTSNEDAN